MSHDRLWEGERLKARESESGNGADRNGSGALC